MNQWMFYVRLEMETFVSPGSTQPMYNGYVVFTMKTHCVECLSLEQYMYLQRSCGYTCGICDMHSAFTGSITHYQRGCYV